MKHNVLRIALVSCLLITSLFFGGAAYAQDEELPDPGLTPDSPFYFLDKWGKSIGMFFTFGEEAKARRALQYAEERLAEAKAMASRNRLREMELAADDYNSYMNTVRERLEAAARLGVSDNISERVSMAASKHLSILDRLKDELPEQAYEALTRARTASMNGQLNALRVLSQERIERAIDIAADTIDNRLERARVRATENITADVEDALDYVVRIAQLEEEITALAEEKGIDITAIVERLAQSTSNRLDVLSEVYEEVPEAARQGIANAIENSVRMYERAVESLTLEDAISNIPNAETVINRLQSAVRERLGFNTDDETEDSDNISIDIQIRIENQEQNQGRVSETETQRVDAEASDNETENRGRSP